jgi:hypothetical protein
MAYFRAPGRRCLALALLALLPAALGSAQARPAASASRRAGPAAARTPPLTVFHDGQGVVTVLSDQASIREVLVVLSKWFHFPIVNLESIPDTRSPIRFEQVPVAQVVDRLLRSVGLNYVILTNPRTFVPTRVVAAPRLASSGVVYQEEPRGQAGRAALIPSLFPGPDGGYQGSPAQTAVMPGTPGVSTYPMPAGPGPMPMPMPMPMPADGTGPFPQPMPPFPMPEPATLGSTPGAAPKTPAASKPGVVVPVAPPSSAMPPGTKMPGVPNS